MGAIIKSISLTDAGGSATEVVSVSDLKTYLQIEGTAYDGPLGIFITSARQLVEQMCSVSLIEKTVVALIHNTGHKPFKLPFGPVDSISLVEWKKCPSVWAELVLTDYEYSADINYNAFVDACEFGLFRVTYSLGVDGRPVFAQAIKAQAGYMFTNRDSKSSGSAEIAPEVRGLLQSYIIIA